MTTNLDVTLLEKLWRVADEAKRSSDGMLTFEYEISHAQIVILRALVRRQCRGTLTEIAKLVGCTNENAGRLVARLVQSQHLALLAKVQSHARTTRSSAESA